MEKSGRLITYLLLAICVAIPFVIVLLSRLIANASADRNGHGIDGVGAALVAGVIIRIFQILSYVAYLVLWVYSIVRVFRLGMPKWVIILPIIPIATFIIMNMIGNAGINKAREAYTAEVYIEEVLQKKKKYSHITTDGDTAISAYSYILGDVVSDLWIQKYRYNMEWQERKTLVDEAIPVLMKDLESETLCYEKMWAPDGTKDGKFYKTTIEYWNYEPNTDTLTVKFSHKEEPNVVVNKWIDKK